MKLINGIQKQIIFFEEQIINFCNRYVSIENIQVLRHPLNIINSLEVINNKTDSQTFYGKSFHTTFNAKIPLVYSMKYFRLHRNCKSWCQEQGYHSFYFDKNKSAKWHCG